MFVRGGGGGGCGYFGMLGFLFECIGYLEPLSGCRRYGTVTGGHFLGVGYGHWESLFGCGAIGHRRYGVCII